VGSEWKLAPTVIQAPAPNLSLPAAPP
jgi:hypothetical protein